MSRVQEIVKKRLKELVECTIITAELVNMLRTTNLVTSSEYEELFNYLRNGRHTIGASYLYSSIATKLDEEDEENFILSLKEGNNKAAIKIFSLDQSELEADVKLHHKRAQDGNLNYNNTCTKFGNSRFPRTKQVIHSSRNLCTAISSFINSTQRVQEELIEIYKNPISPWKVQLHQKNIMHWIVSIPGLDGRSPYYGGIFRLSIKFNNAYPSSPPKMRILTKLYHMNISEDGFFILDILRKGKDWNEKIRIPAILSEVQKILVRPNLTQPCHLQRTRTCLQDKPNYIRRAYEWTALYAR